MRDISWPSVIFRNGNCQLSILLVCIIFCLRGNWCINALVPVSYFRWKVSGFSCLIESFHLIIGSYCPETLGCKNVLKYMFQKVPISGEVFVLSRWLVFWRLISSGEHLTVSMPPVSSPALRALLMLFSLGVQSVWATTYVLIRRYHD